MDFFAVSRYRERDVKQRNREGKGRRKGAAKVCSMHVAARSHGEREARVRGIADWQGGV
jgi:hypothetical protein